MTSPHDATIGLSAATTLMIAVAIAMRLPRFSAHMTIAQVDAREAKVIDLANALLWLSVIAMTMNAALSFAQGLRWPEVPGLWVLLNTSAMTVDMGVREIASALRKRRAKHAVNEILKASAARTRATDRTEIQVSHPEGRSLVGQGLDLTDQHAISTALRAIMGKRSFSMDFALVPLPASATLRAAMKRKGADPMDANMKRWAL